MRRIGILFVCLFAPSTAPAQTPAFLKQPPDTWVKRSPLPLAPPSPALGYEASLAYDPASKTIIRWGGHNQGGGGELNAETWTFDPRTARWTLKEPNLAPPGVCCAQQNVFDLDQGRFLRFAAFSGSHGWHWFRENYLNNSSVWSYDPKANVWRDLRTVPAPHPRALRCAAWDTDHQVAVIFGGEGSNDGTVVYDPYTNTWYHPRPKKQPAFRSAGNMAYDSRRGRFILFGSQFSDDPHTWSYDLRRNEWTDLKPTVQPPTDRNDAVLVYDPLHDAIIANIRVVDEAKGMDIRTGHFETWTYHGSDNTWKKRTPPQEPPGWGNRRRIMVHVPDLNVTVMENYVNPASKVPGVDREQQMWTYRLADPVPPPNKVGLTDVRATTEPGAVRLDWKLAFGAPKAIRVLRATGPVSWNAAYRQIAELKGDAVTFRDGKVEPGKVHYYRIYGLDESGRPQSSTPVVRTQPRTVEDVVVSVLSPKEIRLDWKAHPGQDIAGYHVERAVVEVFSEDEVHRLKKDTPPLDEPSVGTLKAIGPFARLTKEPLAGTTWMDTAIDLTRPHKVEEVPVFRHRFPADRLDPQGKPYRFAVFAYRVRAVNRLGVVGGPGPYALTIPSSPQWPFAKEDGEVCHLKWAANPEKNLRGYRIYRMEPPRINGPGQKTTRRTPEPLAKTSWTDPTAGKVTRRYWIVAVDALGQEGFPSAPVWANRQYRKYYEPFTGPWHQ